MSNWGRNYNANRNHNSVPNYPQGDGSRSFESWSDYSFPPAGEGSNDYFTQNNVPIGGGGTYNGELNVHPGSEYYQSGATTNIPLSNYEINSDIWARAAGSQLTPTAGEFIPSATYTYQPQGRPSSASQSNHGQQNQDPNYSNNDIRTRPYVTSMNSSHVQDNAHSQGRNFDKSKNRSSDNGRSADSGRSADNGRRMSNIEQSKAEGRKKLLQEVAGISRKQNDTSGNSGASGEASFLGRGKRGFSDKGSQNSYRNNDARAYSRSGRLQDHRYQAQRYSPPRRSTAGMSPHRSNTNKKGADDAASQRDRLTEQLNRGTLECLVCCDVVRQNDHTWSCHNCYHVLHLRCTVKWATTSKADNGWRCPACQNVTTTLPKEYYCFCGRTVNPDWSRTDTAHSCGETCNRDKVLASVHYSCVHRCTLLCHPGPCPPCVALVTRKCGCGATSQKVQCGQLNPLLCDSVCDKALSCGKHRCENKCHLGDCHPCQIVVKQVCACGKESREVGCAEEGQGEGAAFECGGLCERQLSCGQHQCPHPCHVGPCGPCQRDPSLVTHCYCGKTPLPADQPRTSCLDPIPTCSHTCSKRLTCGQPSHPHECRTLCHDGRCPPCEQTTLVRCRCGHMDQEIPCTELTTKADDARCQKKCTKKRACGKHKCNQLCCIDVDHVCPLVCNHMLSCGNHRCDLLCHRGHCQPCLQSRFEELYCECRSSVLMPPIPCGTKPPPCNKPCSRAHICEHQVLHECHSQERCPPCTVLTTKHCHGKHELRKAVPCHLKAFSCGLACMRALSCGRHKCIQSCHEGECAAVCRQPCTRIRDLCGHQCNSPCHDGDCPDTPCKEKVVVTCECGHRNMSRPCFENNSEYQRIATSLLASKMADVQLGRSVNLDDMQGPRKLNLKTLECSEECRVMERNRRLAIGLQIRNPDLSAKLTPRYSDFMRAWAKKDQRFCQHVHDKLTELVKLAKESKQKSRSYSFEMMNREKRQFVHEYCTHFGCESVAYDAEPKRNVVATAQRDKAWLPSYSLQEVVQREMGQRRVPVPSLNSSSQKATSQSNVLPVRVALNQPQLPKSDGSHIDYFDYNNS